MTRYIIETRTGSGVTRRYSDHPLLSNQCHNFEQMDIPLPLNMLPPADVNGMTKWRTSRCPTDKDLDEIEKENLE